MKGQKLLKHLKMASKRKPLEVYRSFSKVGGTPPGPKKRVAKKKTPITKKFKPHKMYSKAGKMKMANTMKDHLRLKKLGYNHTKKK